MKKLVLIVDDESLTRNLMRRILEKDGFKVLEAENGKEAIRVLEKGEKIPVVITDLHMPDMNGHNLIDHVLTYPHPPVILVHSAVNEIAEIIELIKKGVIDFIPKPIVPEEMILRVNKSMQLVELQDIQKQQLKEDSIRIETQLDWNRWKFQAMKNTNEKEDNAILESLRTSFSQGIGFGSLIPTIQLIKRKAKVSEDGKTATVPISMLEVLYDNMEAGKKLIETFELFQKISDEPMNFETIKLSTITDIINEIAEKLKSYFEYKNLSISIYKNRPKFFDVNIKIEMKNFQLAINELLVNAIKFSEPGSKIYVLSELDGEFCKISVLNEPVNESNYAIGVPKEYAELVFEPLFRLSKLVHEFIPTMDYGLGLTLVRKIVQRLNGSTEAYNLQSHLGNHIGKVLTNISMKLPISS